MKTHPALFGGGVGVGEEGEGWWAAKKWPSIKYVTLQGEGGGLRKCDSL